jgi:uncharacterized RDD family membrane protein YckC
MSKQRFRDIKQGRVAAPMTTKQNKSNVQSKRAGVRSRLKAFITDSFMLVMPLMYIIFYFVFGGRDGFAENKLLGWIYILIPLIIIQIIFMSISKKGQTPGMRAYNLSLVDLKSGKKPHSGVIAYRQMLTLLSLFTFGWTTMFFRKDHRTLHELLSNTTLDQLPEQEKDSNEKPK